MHQVPAAALTSIRDVAMQDGGVLLVATTRENVSPSLVLELLKRIGGIIKVNCLPASLTYPAKLAKLWACAGLQMIVNLCVSLLQL